MASGFTMLWLLIFILLPSVPATTSDDEEELLQGINSYRQSKNVAPLENHDRAGCIAQEIADQWDDRPCPIRGPAVLSPPQLNDYPKLVRECGIDINTTTDGVILPVCVPKRVSTLLLTNYTQTTLSGYLNDSRYIGVGVGMDHDWTVLILTTNTPKGSFASAANRIICPENGIVLSILVGLFMLMLA